jgi:hypothetical protein
MLCFLLFFLSLFIFPSLASSTFAEFLRFFDVKGVDRIDFEPGRLEKCRSKISDTKSYFKEEFKKLDPPENLLRLLLVFGRQFLVSISSSTVAEQEFSKTASNVLDEYFRNALATDRYIWVINLGEACLAIAELKNSPATIPELSSKFYKIINLLDDDEKKHKVSDALHNIFFPSLEGGWDDVLNFRDESLKEEVIKQKNTLVKEYHEKLPYREDRRNYYTERLRSMILGLKTQTFTIPDFMMRNPDFMIFLLYDYLSLQSEETLLRLFLKDSHPENLMDILGVKSLKDLGLFVTYCEKTASQLKDGIIEELGENWKTKFSEPYKLSKQIMKETFFSKLPEGLDLIDSEIDSSGLPSELGGGVAGKGEATGSKPPPQPSPVNLSGEKEESTGERVTSPPENPTSENPPNDGSGVSGDNWKIFLIIFLVIAALLIASIIIFIAYRKSLKSRQ